MEPHNRSWHVVDSFLFAPLIFAAVLIGPIVTACGNADGGKGRREFARSDDSDRPGERESVRESDHPNVPSASSPDGVAPAASEDDTRSVSSAEDAPASDIYREIEKLESRGGDLSIDALEAMLANPDRAAAMLAGLALGHLARGEVRARKALLRGLDSVESREGAFAGIVGAGPGSGWSVPTLLRLIESADSSSDIAGSMIALEEVGSEASVAAPVLAGYVSHSNRRLARLALWVLASFRASCPEAILAYEKARSSDDEVTVAAGLYGAWCVGRAEPLPVVDALRRALTAGADQDRLLLALASMGPLACSAASDVVAVFYSGNEQTKILAADALGAFQVDDTDVIAALSSPLLTALPAWPDDMELLQLHCIDALGRIGKSAAGSTPHLIRLLDRDALRPVAERAIKGFGRDAIPWLKAAVADSHLLQASRDGAGRLLEWIEENVDER